MAHTPNAKFRTVHTITHPEGVLIEVTQRVGERRHSFAILKSYVGADGKPTRAAFLNRRHLAGLRASLDELEAWLDREEDRTAADLASAPAAAR